MVSDVGTHKLFPANLGGVSGNFGHKNNKKCRLFQAVRENIFVQSFIYNFLIHVFYSKVRILKIFVDCREYFYLYL